MVLFDVVFGDFRGGVTNPSANTDDVVRFVVDISNSCGAEVVCLEVEYALPIEVISQLLHEGMRIRCAKHLGVRPILCLQVIKPLEFLHLG